MEQNPQSLLDQIPGYREAVEKEKQFRAESFSELGDIICGFEVVPITLWHTTILNSVGSPFAIGAVAGPKDCKLFLWIMSPQYPRIRGFCDCLRVWCPSLASLIMRVFKRRFNARFFSLKHPFEEVEDRIRQFIRETYYDSNAVSSNSFNPPMYSSTAGIIGEIASNLHFSAKEIKWMPIKELIQYQRWLIAQDNPGKLFNPSDRIRGEWLRSLTKN